MPRAEAIASPTGGDAAVLRSVAARQVSPDLDAITAAEDLIEVDGKAALANKNITAVGKPASDYAQPMHGRIAVNAAAAAVAPALPKANEAPQEAPLRIGVALEGPEKLLGEATTHVQQRVS